MLDSNKVPVSQSALLVIDAQDSFKTGSRWDQRSNLAFEKNVSALVEAYRVARLPVVFFLHTDKDEGFARDSPSFKLMDFLKPRADEPVMVKNTRNCFTSTTLQPQSQTGTSQARSSESTPSANAQNTPYDAASHASPQSTNSQKNSKRSNREAESPPKKNAAISRID